MNEVLDLFRKTGALLHGHFILRSGLHSREFFQCAILLQHAGIAARVCGLLADKLRGFDYDAVISPAVGGIVVGQESRGISTLGTSSSRRTARVGS